MADQEKEKDVEKKAEDVDWKTEAAAAKAKLEEDLEKEKEVAGPLPPASFTLHLVSLANQAFISLGLMPNPVTGEAATDLDQAKYIIDTVQVIKDKTKGNLAEEEQTMLDQVLYDLRMKYVQASG